MSSFFTSGSGSPQSAITPRTSYVGASASASSLRGGLGVRPSLSPYGAAGTEARVPASSPLLEASKKLASSTYGLEHLKSVEGPLVEAAMSDVERKKAEAALHAERLWWSEASERHMQELEMHYGDKFQEATGRLRNEIATVQDRMEMMVEAERTQRHAAVAEVRRVLDTQQVDMTELKHLQAQLQAKVRSAITQPQATGSMRPQAVGVEVEHVERLRADLNGTRSQHEGRLSALAASVESHQVRAEVADAALQDLRRELSNHQERQLSHGAQHEALAQELRHGLETQRHELGSLRETSRLQVTSNEEVQALHQVIMDSAGDLSRGIEEVSAAVLATEHKFRKDVEAVRLSLDAADAQYRNEALDAIEAKGAQLARRLEDEREQRTMEAAALRARLDASSSQLEDLELLRSRFFALEQQATSASAVGEAARRAEELAHSLGERTNLLEGCLAGAITEESGRRIAELGDLKMYIEELCRSRPLVVEGIAGDHKSEAAATKAFQAELSAVRAKMQLIDVEVRRSVSACERLATDAKGAGAQFKSGLESRLLALEEYRAPKGASEGRPGVSKELELGRLEGEVRKMVRELAPMSTRLDAAEADARKAAELARGIPSLADRLVVSETHLRQLVCECGTTFGASIEALHGELAEMKSWLLQTPSTHAETPLTESSFDNSIRGRSQRESAAQHYGRQANELRYAVRGVSPCRGSSPGRKAETSMPLFSAGLRDSVHNLVRKVTSTITTAASAPAKQEDYAPPPVVDAHNLDASVGREGFVLALKAVQELRERNLTLREENAELAEELLAQDGLLTPSSSVANLALGGELPQWPPSQQHSALNSASPTPGHGYRPTVQLVQPVARRDSAPPAPPTYAAFVATLQVKSFTARTSGASESVPEMRHRSPMRLPGERQPGPSVFLQAVARGNDVLNSASASQNVTLPFQRAAQAVPAQASYADRFAAPYGHASPQPGPGSRLLRPA